MHTNTHTHTHTHTHTNTPQCSGSVASGAPRDGGCVRDVSSRCESPAAISDRSRDGQAMDGGVSQLATAAGTLGGRKRKGETPTGGFGTSSTVSRPSRQVREMIKQ